MTRVWVPAGVTGNAVPTDASWWTTGDPPPGLVAEQTDSGLLLSGAGTGPDITLIGIAPIARWLPGDMHVERLAAIDDWEREVLALASARPERVHLVGLTGPPSGPAEVLALAAGDRWPLPDAADAATRDARTATITVPGADGEGPVAAFAQALGAALDPAVRTSWSTVTAGVADAIASLACGTVAPPRSGWREPSVEEARALLTRSRATRDRLAEANVVLLGCRTALLWPVPVLEGRVATDVVAEVAHEVLRGQLRSPVVWPDGLAELNELELEVSRLRHERDERRATEPALAQLSGRELVARLRGKR